MSAIRTRHTEVFHEDFTKTAVDKVSTTERLEEDVKSFDTFDEKYTDNVKDVSAFTSQAKDDHDEIFFDEDWCDNLFETTLEISPCLFGKSEEHSKSKINRINEITNILLKTADARSKADVEFASSK